MVTPIVSSKYRHLYQFCYVKIFSTNQNGNLVLLEDPGRVRSQKINVVCQIQRFDFDYILAISRKVIIRIPPVLGLINGFSDTYHANKIHDRFALTTLHI